MRYNVGVNVQIEPGKYVVAVSGGVDSMALLDMLAHTPGLELVVAHFEHGIRKDSMEDCRLVEAAAKRYGLVFVYEHGHLGPDTGEATARDARYAFLRKVRAGQGAAGIITAHHQGDVLETAILNMVRGTGRKGLSSLRSTDEIIRPLLDVSKDDLYTYAATHGLTWHEDSTNADERYLRNYIRRNIVPKLSKEQRKELIERITTGAALNEEIDKLLSSYISADRLERQWFIMLPHALSCEVLAAWLRQHGAAFDRRAIDRLVIFSKTARPGKQADVDARHRLEIDKQYIILLANTPGRCV